MFYSLADQWNGQGGQIRLVDAVLRASRLPILRNFPSGIQSPHQADLVFLPKLIGALGLRDTHQVPSLAVVHDVGVLDYPGDRIGMNFLTYYTILRNFRALHHASHLIADSQFTRDRLLRQLPRLEKRISVVPCGVGPAFLTFSMAKRVARQRIEAMLGMTLGDPLLINVGSELPRKNFGLLLHALRAIKSRYPDSQLLKVGGAGGAQWRRRTRQAMDRLRLVEGRDLLFVENLDDPTLATAYRAADVFGSTSLYEGFGLPALEAMAIGTPVVVSNRGALPEVVGAAGWVVEPEVTAFADAIAAVLSDSDAPERSRCARHRAAGFTWERAAQGYFEVMQAMV